MTVVSSPVDRASIIAQFVSVVQNPIMSGGTAWGNDTPLGRGSPHGGPSIHRLMGPRSQANPSVPSTIGEVTTTNMFYLLHGFAVALTRHRRARAWVLGNANISNVPTHVGGFDLGYALTSYAINNTIWFNYPSIPTVGTPMNAATLTAFLNALRNEVASIRTQNNYASDMLFCHSSCHTSCHSSRGRR